MPEFKWVEKITDKVWVAFLLWVGLALIANLYVYLVQTEGTLVQATLQLVGLFFFLKALWKWHKRRKPSSQQNPGTSLSNSQFAKGAILVLVATALIAIVYYVGSRYSSSKVNKYESCMIECEDAQLTKTQDSICKVECIKKYK